MVHIFFPLARRTERIGRAAASLTLVALLALAGCASVPPPDGAMNQAQAQLQSARDAGASDYAPVDLGFAQDKFQQAQTAMAQRNYKDAANLAEEARADAELARAKARLGNAQAQIKTKLEDNARLRAQAEQPIAPAPANPPAAAASSDGAPAPPVLEDMPAPSASVLAAPVPQGQGFQPAPAAQPNPSQGHDQGQHPEPAQPEPDPGHFDAVPGQQPPAGAQP
jgi:hypothetical protein